MTDINDNDTTDESGVDSSYLFDIMALDTRYENVRKSRDKDIGAKVTYWVKDKVGNDAGSISLGRETLIYVDNFPRHKAYYRSDIPVKTWEEIESDAKRCGLELLSNSN